MPICGYVVVPRKGELAGTAEALSRLEGCEVFPAENEDLLLLVTETESLEADAILRRSLRQSPGIQALLLTFGEIDPDAPVGDPVRELER
ncbi:MAG TPA: hypothetical protein VK858_07965 [Longimicrobiales bacterium]|nr:hypothetical protein [Longimicrobiales bacterium]